jgi:hypothetical protein
VRFQVLVVVSMKMTVVRDVAPYSLLETDHISAAGMVGAVGTALMMEAVSTSQT